MLKEVKNLFIFLVLFIVFSMVAIIYVDLKEGNEEDTKVSEEVIFVTLKSGKGEEIKISNPNPEQLIKSPLTIMGQAKGTWFFEGDFPILITDWDGKIIAESYASAKGDWMTEDYVDFEGVVEFEKPVYKNNGALILHKDNPSDLPEHDDALEIPILFE